MLQERYGSLVPMMQPHLVGFDDGPFAPEHRGDVPLIGAVCCGTRLDGVLRGRVQRDGRNDTRAIVELVQASRFRAHLQGVLLQGIALAGFNVIDLGAVQQALGLPVLAICRREPDLPAVRRALLERVPGGAAKWRLIQRAGAPQPPAGVWVQRAGLDPESAAALIRALAVHSRIPEPLRYAHLIATAWGRGTSRQRV
jgi:endonuclease V-like protein UPF0215 family